MFKKSIAYRMKAPLGMSTGALADKLETRPGLPCTGLVARTAGWCAATPENVDSAFAHQVGDRFVLLTMVEHLKILPAAAIKELVAEKAAEHEKRLGFKPGRRQLRDIKDNVIAEQLPKALQKKKYTHAAINLIDRVAFVHASAGQADALTSLLRDTLGELAWEPLLTKQSAAAQVTGWVRGREAPFGFEIEPLAEMKTTPRDGVQTIRYINHPLEGAEVAQKILEGMVITKVGLCFKERLSFVLSTKDLELTAIHQDIPPEAGDADVPEPERYDADALLFYTSLSAATEALVSALGGYAE